MHSPLDLNRLAQELGLPSRWIEQQVLAGRIPALRLGRGFLRFDLRAVQAAISRMAAAGMAFSGVAAKDPSPSSEGACIESKGRES
jgi:hypothetical protein